MKDILFVIMSMPLLVAADLPVREVILYKNGVAYFSRSGELKPGESVKLDFKAAEMNDLLKSLTVSDGSGGKVTAVRYDSAEPLDRRLADFPVQIGKGQPFSVFLDQMRGAQISIRYNVTENLTGTIVSARVIGGAKERAESEQLTILTDAGELRNFDLFGVNWLKFTDPAIDRQLKSYLAVVAQSRSNDRKSVYIDSTSAAARSVAAAYMIPMPVWKSSYRLILDDKAPMLEGWAIVDNTTADDWTGIRLSLVSGRPVSFISRLYEPKYRQRPYGDLAEEDAVGPKVYQGGVIGGVIGGAPAPAPASNAKRARSEAVMAAAPEVAFDRAMVAPSAVQVNTAGREVGELFAYNFSTPVTIKRGESAMLPFLQEKVSARKLLIYSGESVNPMNAAEITNSTGKTLDGGPITVYDSGAYGGEALVETLKSGDKRLISYAVDLGTRVTTNVDSSRDLVREIHFSRGILTTRSAMQESDVYTIKNVDAKSKTLIIEHPIRSGYKLMGAKPVETTPTAYRFEVKLAANSEAKFPVNEEYLYSNSIAVANESPDTLISFLQSKTISEAARSALQGIADKKREIAAGDSELKRLAAESQEVERDQDRIRQNIASLNRVSGQEQQVQQYSRQLAAGESKIVSLRDQASELRRKQQVLQAQLDSLLEKTSF